MASLNTRRYPASNPMKGQYGNLPSNAGASPGGTITPTGKGSAGYSRFKDPKAAAYRRYIRRAFGVSDIREATEQQKKALRAKGLLGGSSKAPRQGQS